MLLRDLTYAARTLRANPVFTITAVLTVALGVGASTTIFSVANSVLLRPLPYKDPGRLALAVVDLRKRGVTDLPLPTPDFLDLRDGTKAVFEDCAALSTGRTVQSADDGTREQVRFAAVTPNFFRLMGAAIAVGRDFSPADGVAQQTPPLPTVVILSHDFWRRRYGGNPAVLGRGMTNGGAAGPQIVGVLAPGFELHFAPNLNVERTPDFWIAARLPYDNTQRNTLSQWAIGRLKDGVTLDRAQAAADAVAAELRKNFLIKETSGEHLRLTPIHKHLVAEVRPALLSLMGAVIFLLLIACANVANLLLVRASLREREFALRAALGGSRWRLVRQVLVEALLLSTLGTLLGLALARFGLNELLVIAPPNLPRLQSIDIDPVVLAFTALAGLAAAALFGITPALQASRPDLIQVLRAGGRTAGFAGGRFLRHAVVIAEVALCLALLIGSGLMFRSFLALQRVETGYDPHRLLTFLLLGGRGGPDPLQRATLVREIQTRLRAIPGVESVTASSQFPLAGPASPIRWGTEQALNDPSKFQAVDQQVVLPGYFETLRTPVLAGRTFAEPDSTPDRPVAVIDQFLAAKAFSNETAVGKRILIRIRTPEAEWVEIIGVVAHQRQSSLAEPGREQIYFTDGFLGHGAATRWALRTSGNPANYASAVRAEIARLDPRLLISELQPMDALVDRAQARTRFTLLLLAIFAAVAALLSGVGLYGVLSTVVRQRTAEIGVRMALGAEPGAIFHLIVGHGLRLSILGIALGLAAAFGLTRWIESQLVGVKPTDPATFVGMTLLFLAVAALASWLPARRAAALDPTLALREE